MEDLTTKDVKMLDVHPTNASTCDVCGQMFPHQKDVVVKRCYKCR